MKLLCMSFALMGFVGVAASAESSSRTEPGVGALVTSPAEQPEQMSTCQFGYYSCNDASGGGDYPYTNFIACVDGCGAMGTKTQVFTICNNDCTLACVDSGYLGVCVP
jgi:hypothetical protein